jgi:hypothetical protein
LFLYKSNFDLDIAFINYKDFNMKNVSQKSLLLSTFLLAISALNVNASLSETCNITNAEFDNGILYRPYHNEIGSWYQVNFHRPFVISGMTGYAAEMDAWEDYVEYWEEVDRVESLNQNLADNKAYAFIYQVQFSMDEDGDGQLDRWYMDGDIMKGADWNNNGLIDCIENHPVLTHVNNEISI